MPDSVPNYLRTATDGSVSAVFPGGVEINANQGGIPIVPSAGKAVRWTRQSDGAVVAAITGTDTGGSGFVTSLGSQNPLTAELARLDIQSGASGVPRSQLVFTTDGLQRWQIIDAIGNSIFPRWAGVQSRTVGLTAVQQRFNGSINGGATVTFSNLPAGFGIFIWVGSCYQVLAGATASIDCFLDGQFISTCNVFCNEASSHHTCVPLFYATPSPAGTHTMGMATNAANGTNSDANDTFQAIAIIL